MSVDNSAYELDVNIYTLYDFYMSVLKGYGRNPAFLDLSKEVLEFFRVNYLARQWSKHFIYDPTTGSYSGPILVNNYHNYLKNVVPPVTKYEQEKYFYDIENNIHTNPTGVNIIGEGKYTYNRNNPVTVNFSQITCGSGHKYYNIFNNTDGASPLIDQIIQNIAIVMFGNSPSDEELTQSIKWFYSGKLNIIKIEIVDGDTDIKVEIDSNNRLTKITGSDIKIANKNCNFSKLNESVYNLITSNGATITRMALKEKIIGIVKKNQTIIENNSAMSNATDIIEQITINNYTIDLSIRIDHTINNAKIIKIVIDLAEVLLTSNVSININDITYNITYSTTSDLQRLPQLSTYIAGCRVAQATSDIVVYFINEVNKFIKKDLNNTRTNATQHTTSKQDQLQNYLAAFHKSELQKDYDVSFDHIENAITDTIEMQSSIFSTMTEIQVIDENIPDVDSYARNIQFNLSELHDKIILEKNKNISGVSIVPYKDKFIKPSSGPPNNNNNGQVNLTVNSKVFHNSPRMSSPLNIPSMQSFIDNVGTNIKKIELKDDTLIGQIIAPAFMDGNVNAMSPDIMNNKIGKLHDSITNHHILINKNIYHYYKHINNFGGDSIDINSILTTLPPIYNTEKYTKIDELFLGEMLVAEEIKNEVMIYLKNYCELNKRFIDILSEKDQYDMQLIEQKIDALLKQVNIYVDILANISKKNASSIDDASNMVDAYKSILSKVSYEADTSSLKVASKLALNMGNVTVDFGLPIDVPEINDKIGDSFIGLDKIMPNILRLLSSQSDYKRVIDYIYMGESSKGVSGSSDIDAKFKEVKNLSNKINNIGIDKLNSLEMDISATETIKQVKTNIGKIIEYSLEIYRTLLTTFKDIVGNFGESISINTKFDKYMDIDYSFLNVKSQIVKNHVKALPSNLPNLKKSDNSKTKYEADYKNFIERSSNNLANVKSYYEVSRELQGLWSIGNDLINDRVSMIILLVCAGALKELDFSLLISMFNQKPDKKQIAYGNEYIKYSDVTYGKLDKDKYNYEDTRINKNEEYKLVDNSFYHYNLKTYMGIKIFFDGLIKFGYEEMNISGSANYFSFINYQILSHTSDLITNNIKYNIESISNYKSTNMINGWGYHRNDLILRNVLMILELYNTVYPPMKFHNTAFTDSVPSSNAEQGKFLFNLKKAILNLKYRLCYLYIEKLVAYFSSIKSALAIGGKIDAAESNHIDAKINKIKETKTNLNKFKDIDGNLRVFDNIKNANIKLTSINGIISGNGLDLSHPLLIDQIDDLMVFAADAISIISYISSSISVDLSSINDFVWENYSLDVHNSNTVKYNHSNDTKRALIYLLDNIPRILKVMEFAENYKKSMNGNYDNDITRMIIELTNESLKKLDKITGKNNTISNIDDAIYSSRCLISAIYIIASKLIDSINMNYLFEFAGEKNKDDAIVAANNGLNDIIGKLIENFNTTDTDIQQWVTKTLAAITKISNEKTNQLSKHKLMEHTEDERNLKYIRYFRFGNKPDVFTKIMYVYYDRENAVPQEKFDRLEKFLQTWKFAQQTLSKKFDDIKISINTDVNDVSVILGEIMSLNDSPIEVVLTDVDNNNKLKLINGLTKLDESNTLVSNLKISLFGSYIIKKKNKIDVDKFEIFLMTNNNITTKNITSYFADFMLHLQNKAYEKLHNIIKDLKLHGDAAKKLFEQLKNTEHYYEVNNNNVADSANRVKDNDMTSDMWYISDYNESDNTSKTLVDFLNMTRFIENSFSIDKYLKTYDRYRSCQSFKYISKYLVDRQKKALLKTYTMSQHIHDFIRPSIFSPFLMETNFLPSNELAKYYTIFNTLRGMAIKVFGYVISLFRDKVEYFHQQKQRDNAFQIFSIFAGNYVEEKESMTIFKYINVGLIEFYDDILNLILEKLIEEAPNNLTPVNQYIYENHYVTVKLLKTFTNWFVNDYLPEKKKNLKEVFQYSIDVDTSSSNSDTLSLIFTIFNEIKDFLAEYQAFYGQKVSIHMRINDFPYPRDPAKSSDMGWKGLSPDPDNDVKYQHYGKYIWEYNHQIFYNDPSDKNSLKLNFNKMCKETTKNPNNIYDVAESDAAMKECIDQSKNTYNEAHKLREKLPFTRIYNSIDYHDPSVIANYMSLASYIKNKQGALIMTYGYSGTGKTYTLFGSSELGTSGVVQNALMEFSVTDKVYLRVYEIYGLGTQYYYYWNKLQENFYQIVIHHEIDPNSIKVNNVKIIEHPEDIQRYIIKNPGDDMDMIKKQGNASTTNIDKDSLYRELTSSELKNFDRFVEEFDKKRLEGVEYNRFLNNAGHRIMRVKATVNNPDSSRSIMVYEFKIKFAQTGVNRKTIYVPLIIYDLPGKEDIKKTFIDPEQADYKHDTAQQEKLLSELQSTIDNAELGKIKLEKAAFIIDPLWIPLLSNNSSKLNVDMVKQIILKYDSVLTDSFKNSIWSESMSGKSIDFPYIESKSLKFEQKQVNSMINQSSDLGLAFASINASRLDSKYKMRPYDTINVSSLEEGTLALVFSAYMSALIENNCLDLIIEIIHDLTGWKIPLIYSYFEAYYINENVIGLLQYLLTTPEIVTKEKADASHNIFKRQQKKTMEEIIREKGINLLSYYLPKTSNILTGESIPNLEFTIDSHHMEILIKYLNDNHIKHTRKGDKISLFDPGWRDTDEFKNAVEYAIYYQMLGTYNSNKIFRSGFDELDLTSLGCSYEDPIDEKDRGSNSNNKRKFNYPILRDFLMPYIKNIDYYYIFYVTSNSQMPEKGEEQLKLIDNSVAFIEAISK